jgi:hypothetical protein
VDEGGAGNGEYKDELVMVEGGKKAKATEPLAMKGVTEKNRPLVDGGFFFTHQWVEGHLMRFLWVS